ncbi:cellulose biosynthesis protein BcsD [Sphingomonas hylomeconis]|uniref:Cellulose biosynthesis protein BcsD n=1 Tax=Sphingomonas hylomeconis TaxID=1395958 RepID=A0ABV7SWL5_9SPHN|nr:cellulose biosynthesis protein BcsD [Sphingomonas hylomeconis]
MTHWPTTIESASAASDLLLGGIVAEIAAGANAAQRRAFYRAVGSRIAALHPLGNVQDIAGLTTAVNTLWADYGCGQAKFAMADDGIVITHTNLPPSLSAVLGEAAEHTMGPLLEGAYDSWLRSLGSGPALTTRTLWWSNTEARLKHGR